MSGLVSAWAGSGWECWASRRREGEGETRAWPSENWRVGAGGGRARGQRLPSSYLR